MVALLLCYNSIAPSTCKDDIMLVLFVTFRGLVNWCIHRLPLAALLACTHELTLLSSCNLSSRRKKALRG